MGAAIFGTDQISHDSYIVFKATNSPIIVTYPRTIGGILQESGIVEKSIDLKSDIITPDGATRLSLENFFHLLNEKERLSKEIIPTREFFIRAHERKLFNVDPHGGVETEYCRQRLFDAIKKDSTTIGDAIIFINNEKDKVDPDEYLCVFEEGNNIVVVPIKNQDRLYCATVYKADPSVLRVYYYLKEKKNGAQGAQI